MKYVDTVVRALLRFDGNSYSVNGYGHNTKAVYQFNDYCFHGCGLIIYWKIKKSLTNWKKKKKIN